MKFRSSKILAAIALLGSISAAHAASPALSDTAVKADHTAHPSKVNVDALKVRYTFDVSLVKVDKGGARHVENKILLAGTAGVPVSYFSGTTTSYLANATVTNFGDGVDATAAPDADDAALGADPAIVTTSDSADDSSSSASLTTGTVKSGVSLLVTAQRPQPDGAAITDIKFEDRELVALENLSLGGGLDVQAPQTKLEGGEQVVRLYAGKTEVVHFPGYDVEVRLSREKN